MSVDPGVPGAVPTGAALRQQAEGALRGLHALASALMLAIHDGVWDVGTGGYGTLPMDAGGGESPRYRFTLRRDVRLGPEADLAAVVIAAAEVLRRSRLQIEQPAPAPGTSAVLRARGGLLGRGVVTVYPSGAVTITLATVPLPGDREEVADLVIEDRRRRRAQGELAHQFFPRRVRPQDPPVLHVPADTLAPPAR